MSLMHDLFRDKEVASVSGYHSGVSFSSVSWVNSLEPLVVGTETSEVHLVFVFLG
jgi:hypothetical protein